MYFRERFGLRNLLLDSEQRFHFFVASNLCEISGTSTSQVFVLRFSTIRNENGNEIKIQLGPITSAGPIGSCPKRTIPVFVQAIDVCALFDEKSDHFHTPFLHRDVERRVSGVIRSADIRTRYDFFLYTIQISRGRALPQWRPSVFVNARALLPLGPSRHIAPSGESPLSD